VSDDLVRAIVEKRLVEFVYKTGRTESIERELKRLAFLLSHWITTSR
jgi:hypothetical protein